MPRVRFGYVFGSTARGDRRPDSDVDVAVLVNPRGTLLEDAALHDRLDQALDGPAVDVVMLNDAPLWLQYRVVAGRPVLARDERERIAHRERVEKQYLDFKPFHDEYLRATRERARRGALSG